jgi:hypothetical protein
MKRLLLIVVLIATLSVAFVIPAQAVVSWECTFDFTVAENGFAPVSPWGSWGSGYTTGDGTFAAPTLTGIRSIIVEETVTSATWTSVTMTFDLTKGHFDPTTPVGVIFLNGSIVASVAEGSITDGTDKTLTWNGSMAVTAVQLQVVTSHDQSDPITYSGASTLKSMNVHGSGDNPFTEGTGLECEEVEGYTRPYAAEDFHTWGMFNNDGFQIGSSAPFVGSLHFDYGVFAISAQPNAHVAAGIDGTATRVSQASLGDCAELFGLAAATPCSLNIPATVNGTSTDNFYGLTGVNPGLSGMISAWRVEITDDDDNKIVYLVENADKYIVEGQTVTAGCWIGESMRMTTAGLGLGVSVDESGPNAEVGIERGYANEGITIINVYESGEHVDPLEDFTEQPTVNAPCNLPEGFDGCEGDSSLETPGQWVSIDAQWRESGGVTLAPGGYIRTDMNLDAAREPGLKVGARAIGANTSLQLTLGQTVQTLSVTTGVGFTRVAIEPGTHAPDGDFYTIEVRNTGGGTAELNYVCAYHSKDGEGDPIEEPDGPDDTPNDNNALCKFADYSFDSPAGVWTLSSGETATGEIRIPASATVTQSVSIPAGTYTLSVVASVWHYSAFVPDDTETDTITFEYDYPADTSYTTISAKTFGAYAENNNTMVHSTSLVLGSDTSGDFVFRAVFSDTPSNVRGVIIRSICIGSEQTGPGESGSGTSGSDWEGPFETGCKAISTPTGTSAIGVWARWFWAKLNGFFQCELMVLLNSIYTAIQRIVLTMGWAIRYNIAVTTDSWRWVGDELLPWLAGYLSNIQPAVVRGNTQEQCNNIFCGIIGILDVLRQVLEEFLGPILDFFLRMLSLVVDIVFLVLNGLLSLVFQLLNLIVGLLVSAVSLITSLILAWNNATPTGIAGLHDCVAEPESVACGVFWLMENTIFSGDAGMLIIPLIASFLHIMTVIRIVKRLLSIAAQAQGEL